MMSVGRTLLTILGVVLLLPGACGIFYYGAVLVTWMSSGFQFHGEEGGFAQFGLIFATFCITISVFSVSLWLRSKKTDWSRKASLGLAIFETSVLVIVLLIIFVPSLVSFFLRDFAQPYGFLQGFSFYIGVTFIPGYFFGVLPAYHYWREGKSI